MKSNNVYVAIVLILMTIFFRLVPHPANFTPILALALFSGASLRGQKGLYLIPVLGLFLSDMILGFHSLSGVIYICFAMLFMFGAGLSKTLKKFSSSGLLKWSASSLFAAIFFFIVTNLAVFWTSGMYPLTSEGLVLCFTKAVPFFRNTFTSTLMFSLGMYSVYSLVPSLWAKEECV